MTRAANEITLKQAMAGRKRRSRFPRAAREDRTMDGIVFDSKAEMKRYQELKVARNVGRIRGFLRQPVFDLAGVVYRADFLVFDREPQDAEEPLWKWVHAEDVKGSISDPRFRGQAQREWRRCARQVEHLHGIRVVLIEK